VVPPEGRPAKAGKRRIAGGSWRSGVQLALDALKLASEFIKVSHDATADGSMSVPPKVSRIWQA
jgi:hypothetical protein